MPRKIRLRKEPNLAVKLRAYSHQKEAFESIKNLEYAAVFHEQGLGKTKIAIDLMMHWLKKDILDTVLIIVKKSLVKNWLDELSIHSYIVPRLLTQNRNKNYYVLNSPSRVILTHFEVIRTEISRLTLFAKTRSLGAIVDESAKIKNPHSKLTRCFLKLGPFLLRKVILTGTPVANRPYDLWSQIYFLDGGESLGEDFSSFKAEFDLTSKLRINSSARDSFESNIGEVFAKIESFSVRETKDSGVIALPDKEIRTIETEWETIQREIYLNIRDQMRAVVVSHGIPRIDESQAILKRLLRLVQVASNPRLIDESYTQLPGKFPYVLDLVQECVDSKEKCIIWTSFRDNVEWLASQLTPFGPEFVHGGLHQGKRNRAISAFKSNDHTKVLIATPGSAKEGLTLTEANHVIFYDRQFSLDDYLQAQDRIHRISQEKRCFVNNLVMKESIDQWVDILLQEKHLAARLAQGDIDLDEYRAAMTYDFDEMLHDVLNIK